MKKISVGSFVTMLIVVAVLATACQPEETAIPTESPQETRSATPAPSSPDQEGKGNPFSPQPGDDELNRGEVEIEKTELMIKESYPVQISLYVEGNLPTPCHQLRAEIEKTDDGKKVNIHMYSLVHPNEMCAQVLEPFEANIPLGSYQEQGVSFWVNGEKVGEY